MFGVRSSKEVTHSNIPGLPHWPGKCENVHYPAYPERSGNPYQALCNKRNILGYTGSNSFGFAHLRELAFHPCADPLRAPCRFLCETLPDLWPTDLRFDRSIFEFLHAQEIPVSSVLSLDCQSKAFKPGFLCPAQTVLRIQLAFRLLMFSAGTVSNISLSCRPRYSFPARCPEWQLFRILWILHLLVVLFGLFQSSFHD